MACHIDGCPIPGEHGHGTDTPTEREAGDAEAWRYEPEEHQDHGGADTIHHVVCGERHIAEVATKADALLIVEAVNARHDSTPTERDARAWQQGFLAAHKAARGGPLPAEHPLTVPDHLREQIKYWNPYDGSVTSDPYED